MFSNDAASFLGEGKVLEVEIYICSSGVGTTSSTSPVEHAPLLLPSALESELLPRKVFVIFDEKLLLGP